MSIFRKTKINPEEIIQKTKINPEEIIQKRKMLIEEIDVGFDKFKDEEVKNLITELKQSQILGKFDKYTIEDFFVKMVRKLVFSLESYEIKPFDSYLTIEEINVNHYKVLLKEIENFINEINKIKEIDIKELIEELEKLSKELEKLEYNNIYTECLDRFINLNLKVKKYMIRDHASFLLRVADVAIDPEMKAIMEKEEVIVLKKNVEEEKKTQVISPSITKFIEKYSVEIEKDMKLYILDKKTLKGVVRSFKSIINDTNISMKLEICRIIKENLD